MANSEQPLKETKGSALSLGAKIDVFPDMPCPEYDVAGCKAYAARSKGDASADLFALVNSFGMPPRLDMANAMRSLDCPAIMRLVDSGSFFMPQQNVSAFAFVYEVPLTTRYRSALNEPFPRLNEDAINLHFVQPMINALVELQRAGIVHNNIRTTNIFWRDNAMTPPQLGDCLAVPAGLAQPVLFETIERGITPPIARGSGSYSDDAYAFGVCLAMLVLGENPLAALADAEIVQAKLERGSFTAFVGNRRIAASHIELLRGLLADDERQRWNANDLEQWVAGRRLTPKNSDIGRRASRHFSVANREYWQARPVGMALGGNPSEVVRVVDSGGLEKWLLRSLGDEDKAKAVADAINVTRASGKSANYEEQLATRVSMALDPAGPIRYRNLAVMPAGVAMLLSEAMRKGESTQVIAEIIVNQFATFWANLQKEKKGETVATISLLERARLYIDKTGYGFGLERVLYELNPMMYCLSPILGGEYVVNARQLLLSLEKIAGRADKPAEPFDRHIAAFLVVRDKRGESLFMSAAPTEQPLRRCIALLQLYSELQYRYGPVKTPGVAAWLLPLTEPAIQRFFSKPFREKVRKEAKAAAEAGNLGLMLKIVDDPQRVERDARDFMMARRMYQDIVKECVGIEETLKDREILVRSTGRPVAATIATFLALILITISLLRFLWHYME